MRLQTRVLWSRLQMQDPNSILALESILTERARQLEVKQWSLEDDDRQTAQQLLKAAVCYLLPALRTAFWPWDLSFWKPTTRRRNYEKAGALLLAEMAREIRATVGEP